MTVSLRLNKEDEKLIKKYIDKYSLKLKNIEKNIWAWSGFKYEDIKDNDVFNYIDVLVDGQYKDELHDPTLKWRGSSNQRVIDIKESKKQNKVCELK